MLQGNSEELLISRCDLTYRRMRELHATIVMKKHFLKYAAQIENIDNERRVTSIGFLSPRSARRTQRRDNWTIAPRRQERQVTGKACHPERMRGI